MDGFSLGTPLWFLVLLFLILPAFWTETWRRRRQQHLRFLAGERPCSECGYDLRGRTDAGTCPECGALSRKD